ncbi:MAG: GlsB/YeaQ/YmgE family stress response rane protein [Phycisphaerales bacterium]|nr:GlsB/YeaQ/YmgE family stress response rane protein [Phycisphaerales bacterium]
MLAIHSIGALVAQTRSSDRVTSFLAWVILGLIAGFIASKLVNRRGEGAMLDILLGIIGAVIGGWLFRVLGMHGVTGFNLWSLLVAVLGAVVLLLIWHGVRGDFHGRPMH